MGDDDRFTLFVSYAREDRAVAESLQRDLVDEHEVWIDEKLTGGQRWWDVILSRIQSCDALLLVCTPSSLSSTACLAEVRWAHALNRVIIPLRCAVDGVDEEMSPSPLSTFQWVPYFTPDDKAEYKKLVRAVNAVERRPLPKEIPPPPPVPLSYVGTLRELMDREDLDKSTQFEIMRQLEAKLDEPEEHERLVQLVEQFRALDPVTSVEKRCIRLLADIEDYAAGSGGASIAVDPEVAYRERALEFLADGRLSVAERHTLDDLAGDVGLSPESAQELLIDVARTAPGSDARQDRYRTTVRETIEEHGLPLPDTDHRDFEVRRVRLLLDSEVARRIEREVMAEFDDPTPSSAPDPLPTPERRAPRPGPDRIAIVNHGAALTAAAGASGDDTFATAGTDLRVMVWDGAGTQPDSIWQVPDTAVDLSLGRRLVAVATMASCFVYDVSGRSIEAVLMPGSDKKTWVTSVLVGPGDRLVVAGAWNGDIEAWSPGEWSSLGKQRGHSTGGAITCMDAHAASGEVVVGTASGQVWAWNLSTESMRPLGGGSPGAPIRSIAVSRDGATATCVTDNGVARAMDRADGSVLWERSVDGEVLASGPAGSDDATLSVTRNGTVWHADRTGLDPQPLPHDRVGAAAVLSSGPVLVADENGVCRVYAIGDTDPN